MSHLDFSKSSYSGRLILPCAVFVLLSLTVQIADAQDRDWANSVNGSWLDAANWNAMDVPDSNAETARFNAGGPYEIFHNGGSTTVGGIVWTDPGATLTIQATAISTSSFTVGSDFTINGVLNLNSDFDGVGVTLTRPGTITNAAGGTINLGGTSATANTLRQLNADMFTNNGIVNVDQSAQFSRTSGVYTNNNMMNVAAGKSLTFGGVNTFNQNVGTFDNQGSFAFATDTLNFNGGNFTGNAVDLHSSTLNIATTGTGVFNMTGSGSYSGDLVVGQQLNLLATAVATNFTTATGDFINSSTINLKSDFDGVGVTLTRPGTITNSAGGTINLGGTSTTANTLRQLNAEIVNQGLIDITVASVGNRIGRTGDNHLNAGQIINRDDATITTILGESFTNQAGGKLSGLGEFDFSATALTNDGIIDPGLGAGQLTLDGDVTFGSTSDLMVELGGLAQGTECDNLIALDSLMLNGDLTVVFIDGFQNTVSSTDVFTILTAGSLSGTFAGLADGDTFVTADGLGKFDVSYAGNDVILGNFSSVPEPSAIVLIALVGGVIALRRRRA